MKKKITYELKIDKGLPRTIEEFKRKYPEDVTRIQELYIQSATNNLVKQIIGSNVGRDIGKKLNSSKDKTKNDFMNLWKDNLSLANLIALDIKKLLIELREIFNKCNSCKVCKRHCCTNMESHFNNKDAFYLIALGEEIPNAKETSLIISFDGDYIRVNRKDRICIFLGNGGCKLPSHIRPYTCWSHVCYDLSNELKRKKLSRKVSSIKEMLYNHYGYLTNPRTILLLKKYLSGLERKNNENRRTSRTTKRRT